MPGDPYSLFAFLFAHEDGLVKNLCDGVDRPQWPPGEERGIFAPQEAALGSV